MLEKKIFITFFIAQHVGSCCLEKKHFYDFFTNPLRKMGGEANILSFWALSPRNEISAGI